MPQPARPKSSTSFTQREAAQFKEIIDRGNTMLIMPDFKHGREEN